MYEYKMVQIPRDFSAKVGDIAKGAIAKYLQGVIDQYSNEGWEFYRIDTVSVTEKPGCFQFWQKEAFAVLNVICFRRPTNA